MYGSSIGKLTVYIRNSGTDRAVWQLSGQQNGPANRGGWLYGRVPIPVQTAGFHVSVTQVITVFAWF